MKDLSLSPERYVVALHRIRDQIAAGSELVYYDDTTPGDKSTHCSWGLCSENKAQWPDPEDHLWPDQFISRGRVAVRYRRKQDQCPLDMRSPDEVDGNGCFWTCRVFQRNQNRFPLTREEALALYDEEITHAEAPKVTDTADEPNPEDLAY